MDANYPVKAMVLVGLLTTPATCFLVIGPQCVKVAHCDCNRNGIVCSDKALTSVPDFDVAMYTGRTPGYFEINLSQNNITSISSNAFANISDINTPTVFIFLSNNNIARINIMAFSGIENRTKKLDLRNNSLSILPTAIGKLNVLKDLNVEGNPISNIDPIVLSHIGKSLVEFRFEMGHLNSWQTTLSSLQHLRLLQINFVPLIDLPQTAFIGIESSLNVLIISHSNLTRMPTSICNLHNINIIRLEYAKFQSNSVFTPCSHTLPATQLRLCNLGIQEFPDVLHTFPSLQALELDHNEIAYIPSSVIPMTSVLFDLNLSFNQLTHVPFALNKLLNLKVLDISSNNIATIEDHDLIGLSNLLMLELNSNPIRYIALHAFDDNTRLYHVSVDNTQLHLIPEVVKHISYVSLNNLAIECSCRMSYLKGWDHGYTPGLDESCANRQNVTIEHYLQTDLRNCP